ncbi:MAG: peptide ABC transporter substrate-binding protein [Thermomicrobiales bacterium]
MVQQGNDLSSIYQALCRGEMTRRAFVVRAAALGVCAPLTLALVNSRPAVEASAPHTPADRPSFGTEGQLRGSGGELKVREWFAPNCAVAHLWEGLPSAARVSSLILEPLLSYAFDGTLLPTLVTRVPTQENGGLSEDLTKVILELRDDIVWSDGEPFTADDVVWTWQWVRDESTVATEGYRWEPIRSIEAVDATTVELTYAQPNPAWFDPIAGSYVGAIVPRHIWIDGISEAVNAEFATNPIGTGPYKVEAFVPGEYVACTINDRYREPNKPYFASVRFQAGGDTASAAQAVLQDGNWDVASGLIGMTANLQQMEVEGGKGRVIAGSPTAVERILFNFSDPHREIEGERSSLAAPHPFLTDQAVRQAMALAIDREKISREAFGADKLAQPTANILSGIPALESPNTSYTFDLEAANRLLDEAGWVRDGDKRSRDGIKLAVSYYTSVSGLTVFKRWRAETQEVVKAGWEAIGIEVEPGQVPGDVFFDPDPENLLSYTHFYCDIEMFSSSVMSPLPLDYFQDWYAGIDNRNVAQQANDWQGFNLQRYVNPEFDALYDEAAATTDPERAAELLVQMNDLIVNDFVVVPLIAQPGEIAAVSNRLVTENVAPSTWEPLFWNIANWRTVDDQLATPAS